MQSHEDPTRERRFGGRVAERAQLFANVAVVVASVVATLVLLQRLQMTPNAAAARSPYKANEPLAKALPVDFSGSARTVLLVVHSRCHYCTEAMPFYRDIERRRSNGVGLIVLGRESTDVLREYASTNGLGADHVLTISGGMLKAAGTPQVIVVDSMGRVQHAWMGALDAGQQQEVLRFVGAPDIAPNVP